MSETLSIHVNVNTIPLITVVYSSRSFYICVLDFHLSSLLHEKQKLGVHVGVGVGM